LIVYRCFAWRRGVRHRSEDGPLWFPRRYQGDGRHDNPEAYGCLYVTDRAVSAVVEQLAPFRGERLFPELLVRRGLPLTLATIELPDDAELVDLDDPRVLARERLRPSRVATRTRDITQPQALALHGRHAQVAGLRWWSTFESLWANVTLFDRAAGMLRTAGLRALTVDDDSVADAAAFLGLA
jgi:hypothetical protein